jgi:UPF0716 protein FxsA
MKLSQFVFLFLLSVPFIEIYLLLEVGSLLGVFPTLVVIVFTAGVGTYLFRKQGFVTWKRVQESFAKGEIPAYEMIEGPILLVGGLLLITPGFFSDLLGFACLIPPVRKAIAKYILEQYWIKAQPGSPFHPAAKQPDALEGEFKKEL